MLGFDKGQAGCGCIRCQCQTRLLPNPTCCSCLMSDSTRVSMFVRAPVTPARHGADHRTVATRVGCTALEDRTPAVPGPDHPCVHGAAANAVQHAAAVTQQYQRHLSPVTDTRYTKPWLLCATRRMRSCLWVGEGRAGNMPFLCRCFSLRSPASTRDAAYARVLHFSQPQPADVQWQRTCGVVGVRPYAAAACCSAGSCSSGRSGTSRPAVGGQPQTIATGRQHARAHRGLDRRRLVCMQGTIEPAVRLCLHQAASHPQRLPRWPGGRTFLAHHLPTALHGKQTAAAGHARACWTAAPRRTPATRHKRELSTDMQLALSPASNKALLCLSTATCPTLADLLSLCSRLQRPCICRLDGGPVC